MDKITIILLLVVAIINLLVLFAIYGKIYTLIDLGEKLFKSLEETKELLKSKDVKSDLKEGID